jgi:hypothetical protein
VDFANATQKIGESVETNRHHFAAPSHCSILICKTIALFYRSACDHDEAK